MALLIGAVIASAWEKIELILLKRGYSFEPVMLEKYPPNPAWHTNDIAVAFIVVFWPFGLIALILSLIYLFIRNIFRL